MHEVTTRTEPGTSPPLRGVLFILAALLLLPLPSHAATIVVDEAKCTLIDAILSANTDSPTGGCPTGAGADTIVLTVDVTLTAPYSTGSGGAGLPILNSQITLQGQGHTISRDGAAPAFRLMAIINPSGSEVRLENVTLTNGLTDDSNSLGGGALVTGGHVTLIEVTVSNSSARSGGGILNIDGLFVHDSTLSGNSAEEDGGAIENAGMLRMTNSTISSNSAGGDGGGLLNGLAIAELTNCTMFGNSAGDSGGALRHVTEGYIALRNSVVANSPSGGNCVGVSGSAGNFDDDGTCGAAVGTITGLDPDLADNGGPTLTHALLPGSSAIDAAGDCGLDTDQRGAPRNDDACDSGAYEFQCSIELYLADDLTWIAFTPNQSAFDIVTGNLADLLADGGYEDALCMGSYPVSPAIDLLADPDPGEGRYFLARGLISCMGAGYGNSSLSPDPRDALDSGPCP